MAGARACRARRRGADLHALRHQLHASPRARRRPGCNHAGSGDLPGPALRFRPAARGRTRLSADCPHRSRDRPHRVSAGGNRYGQDRRPKGLAPRRALIRIPSVGWPHHCCRRHLRRLAALLGFRRWPSCGSLETRQRTTLHSGSHDKPRDRRNRRSDRRLRIARHHHGAAGDQGPA
ncbi:hypothetical protein D3C80_1232280 [compost metagenome]